MLAVAAQLPEAVVAEEPSPGVVSDSNAQPTAITNLMLTTARA